MSGSGALVTTGGDIDRRSELSEAVARVEVLLRRPGDEACSELSEARAKAEAASLWAKRAKHAEEERHFGKLRVIAEAGLGVLSLDGFDVPENAYDVKRWRVLAAAFERRQLLSCCDNGTNTTSVVKEVRRRGLVYVPPSALSPHAPYWTKSCSWFSARLICRQHNIDPASLPPDVSFNENVNKRRRELAAQRSEDAAKWRALRRSRRIGKALREGKPDFGSAYGHIREALDDLGRVSTDGMPPHLKTHLNRAFAALYEAEDSIAACGKLDSFGDGIGIPPPL